MRFVWLVAVLVLSCVAPRPAPPAAVVAQREASPSAPPAPVVVVKTPAAETGRPCARAHAELDALPEKALATIAPADQVVLRRGACFGSCPVYSVTLFGDGRVTAVGERGVAQLGAQAWTIAPGLARRVLSEFVRVDAFTRKATMLAAVSDLPTATLELSIGKRHAELSHYGAGFELEARLGGKDNEVLTKLERLVDQATEAESRMVGCAEDR